MSPTSRPATTLLTLFACFACSGETSPGPTESESPYVVIDPHDGNDPTEKIDLLLMIDNSPSMPNTQKILADAVADLVERFANPVCVDRTTRNPVGTLDPEILCADSFPNAVRQFDPIWDIHIGVITSSLGGHGADSCSNTPNHEDMAHLSERGIDEEGQSLTVDTYQDLGFLNWDPTGKTSIPPGESNIEELKSNFAHLVRGADNKGCEYEASLEAWYRFLIDPAPYARMVPVPCFEGDTATRCRTPEGIDQVVLAQRRDFLRQQSLLAIVMLTDENDCSVIDDRDNFRALQALEAGEPYHLAHGTAACSVNPWDADCKSCWEVSPSQYPECSTTWPDAALDDPLSLRCFEQKRRFGIDFLYPVRRYIDALSNVRLQDGSLNPLYCRVPADDPTRCSEVLRDASLVFLAGIVGVPWQDIALDPWDLKKGYQPTERLSWSREVFVEQGLPPPPGLPPGKTLWNVILGEVDEIPGSDLDDNGVLSEDERNPRYGSTVPSVEPLDPLMRESIDPRIGVHPATGENLVPPDTHNPRLHSVNASERHVPSRNDLQYACVFELGAMGPRDCLLPENALGCDCAEAPDNPLCWDGAQFTTTQYLGKAYPSRRQLAVLKGMEGQGVVASACPANMIDASGPDFGYRPAINAIADRLASKLARSCFGPTLPIRSDGRVPCVVIEASGGERRGSEEPVCPPCEGARQEPTDRQWRAINGHPVVKENSLPCACQLEQAPAGPAHDACVNDLSVEGFDAWCYLDPEQDPTHNADLLLDCPSGNKRDIRFIGDVPAPGSLALLMCEK